MKAVRVKVFLPKSLGGKIRRWRITDLRDLKGMIQDVLQVNSFDALFHLEYLDDVNDWIVLENINDWIEAVPRDEEKSLVVRVLEKNERSRPEARIHANNFFQRCPFVQADPKRGCPKKENVPDFSQFLNMISKPLSDIIPFIVDVEVSRDEKKPEPKEETKAKAESKVDPEFIKQPEKEVEDVSVKRESPKRIIQIQSDEKSQSVPVRKIEPRVFSVHVNSNNIPQDIPVNKAPKRDIINVPVVDEANNIPVVKIPSSPKVEIPIDTSNENVEVPVNLFPERFVRRINIEDDSNVHDSHGQEEEHIEEPQNEEPIVEREESSYLASSSQPQTDYIIENEEEDQKREKSPYDSEALLLQSMGFQDEKLNNHLLNYHKGNVEKTINSLLKLV